MGTEFIYFNFRWPCIPIVQDNDDRIYVRFHSEEYELDELKEISLRGDQNNEQNLLGQNKQKIWNEANEIVSSCIFIFCSLLIMLIKYYFSGIQIYNQEVIVENDYVQLI